MIGKVGHLPAVKDNLAPVGQVESCQQVEQSGFSSSARTHDGGEVSGMEAQAHRLQRGYRLGPVLVRFGNINELNDWNSHEEKGY